MQQAFSQARGEWILATDADMIFEPVALRTAMAPTLESKAAAITLIPHFEARSFWERVMMTTWAWIFLMFTVLYRISNPKTQLWLLFIPAALSWFFQVLVLGIAAIYSKVSPAYALTAPLSLGLVFATRID